MYEGYVGCFIVEKYTDMTTVVLFRSLHNSRFARCKRIIANPRPGVVNAGVSVKKKKICTLYMHNTICCFFSRRLGVLVLLSSVGVRRQKTPNEGKQDSYVYSK